MAKPVDIGGKTYGRLTALSMVLPVAGRAKWNCLCQCGNCVVILSNSLRTGRTLSCGCLKREKASKRLTKVIASGERFSKLVVKRRSGTTKFGEVAWECLCDCGETTFVSGPKLRSRNTTSCGCHGRSVATKDITGLRSGKLVALYPTKEKTNGRMIKWMCQCDCGTQKLAVSGLVVRQLVVSCGCAISGAEVHRPEHVRRKRAVVWHRRRARERMAAGSFSSEQIDELYAKQEALCAACGASIEGRFHRDHIRSLYNGGSNEIGNIQLLCPPCNLKKGRS